jgi:hypothetical protein
MGGVVETPGQQPQGRVVSGGELACQHALEAIGGLDGTSQVLIELHTANVQEQLVALEAGLGRGHARVAEGVEQVQAHVTVGGVRIVIEGHFATAGWGGRDVWELQDLLSRVFELLRIAAVKVGANGVAEALMQARLFALLVRLVQLAGRCGGRPGCRRLAWQLDLERMIRLWPGRASPGHKTLSS